MVFAEWWEMRGLEGMAFALNWALKGSLILTLTWIVHRLLGRGSAALRHRVLALGLTALLAAPVLLVLLPPWNVLPALPAVRFDPLVAVGATALLAAWGLICILLWSRLVGSARQVRRLVSRAEPVLDFDWIQASRALADRIGWPGRAQLKISQITPVALAVGIRTPVVLLPSSSDSWSAERRRITLLHELSHHKRHDNLWNLLAQVAFTCFWFNPLMWWLCEALSVERERACDDLVLSAGTPGSDYVEHLLSLLRSHDGAGGNQLAASEGSALKSRLIAILTPSISRTSVGSLQGRSMLLAALLLLLPLVVVQPLVEQQARAARQLHLEASSAPAPTLQRADKVAGPHPEPDRQVNSERTSLPETEEAGGERLLQSSRLIRVVARPTDPARKAARAREWSGFPQYPAGESARRTGFLGGPAIRGDRDHLKDEIVPDPPGEANGDPGDDRSTDFERIVLDTLGGRFSAAAAINDLGIVAGQSETAAGEVHPFLWQSEAGMIDLGTPADSVVARAVALNSGGDVLVEAVFEEHQRSFLWTPRSGYQDLGSLGGIASEAINLNRNGSVVGRSAQPSGLFRGFFWSGETGMINLGGTEAVAINDRDEVIGRSGSFSFYWHPQDGFARIGEPPIASYAAAINNKGQVVGSYRDVLDGRMRAFVWERGHGLIDLGSPAGVTDCFANSINDQGRILGVCRVNAETVRSFLWTSQTGFQLLDVEIDVGLALPSLEFLVTAFTVVGIGNSLTVWSEEQGFRTIDPELRDAAETVAVNERGDIAGNVDLAEGRRAVVWQFRPAGRDSSVRWSGWQRR